MPHFGSWNHTEYQVELNPWKTAFAVQNKFEYFMQKVWISIR